MIIKVKTLVFCENFMSTEMFSNDSRKMKAIEVDTDQTI